jgi:hypothetical protein
MQVKKIKTKTKTKNIWQPYLKPPDNLAAKDQKDAHLPSSVFPLSASLLFFLSLTILLSSLSSSFSLSLSLFFSLYL